MSNFIPNSKELHMILFKEIRTNYLYLIVSNMNAYRRSWRIPIKQISDIIWNLQ